MKQDLRTELSSKLDHESLTQRATRIEGFCDELKEDIDREAKKVKVAHERLDGHDNRLS